MLRTRNLTLTSTAQEITINDTINTANTISVQNTDASAPVYIGNESVTSSNYGIKLSAGQIWSADLGPNDQVYAVGTSTASILILER
jgi:hypothetical protein